MSHALVVILLLLWALVLLPGALRSRRTSPLVTVGGFNRAMEVLRNRGTGRTLMVPADAERVVRSHARPGRALLARRRRLFTRLVVATTTTGALAVLFGGSLWLLFGVLAGSLAVYVALLLRWKQQRRRAAQVVRALPVRAPAARRAVDGNSAPHVTRQAVGQVQVASRPDEPWWPHAGVRIRRWDP